MKLFDYENAPELEEIRGYFKEAEWKVVCESCQIFDKEYRISKSVVKGWLKDQVSNPKRSLESRIESFLSSLDKDFDYGNLSYNEFQEIIRERLNK
jgi:hypothetical protein